MSQSKNVKLALKEARDFIDKKEFKPAFKACKRALNIEKDNYMALVFAGLCCSELEMIDQAKECYNRAIEKDCDQLVAWQGMIKFAEKYLSKEPKLADDLLRSYTKLQEIYSIGDKLDVDKFFAVSNKLWELQLKKEKINEALETLQNQIKICNKDRFKVKEGHNNIISLLNHQDNLSESQTETLIDSLEILINDEPSVENMEHLKTFIKLLYKLRNMEKLLLMAFKMSNIFSSNSYSLEWICKVYLEWICNTLDFQNSELENNMWNYVNRILDMNPESTLGNLSKGALLRKEGKFKESSDLLRNTLSSTANQNFYGSFILCQCLFELKDFVQAESFIESTKLLLIKVKEELIRSNLEQQLNIMLAKSLYFQFSSIKNKKISELISDVDLNKLPDLKIIALKVQATNENISEDALSDNDFALKELNIIKSMIAKRLGDLKKAKQHIEECLKEEPNDFEALLMSGIIDYESKEFTSSLTSFLKAAKLNPFCSQPFLYLGHLYRFQHKNLDKARRCYQKSFQLDNSSTEAGISLSDVYREQKEDDKNLEFLTSISSSIESNSHGSWALLRLGILYLNINQPSKAISYLQSAIRQKSGNDPIYEKNVWECLADAYKIRGSHNSALKAYEQVLTYNADSLYSKLQVASIKELLGKHLDSIIVFRDILKTNPNYIPALKGLAQALINKAKEYLLDYVNMNVIYNCSEALVHLVKAAKIMPELFCLWKMMGDCCTIIHPLSEQLLTNFKVPNVLIGNDQNTSEVTSFAKDSAKLNILKIGARCYLRSLQVFKNNEKFSADIVASVWHDLACNYYYSWINLSISELDLCDLQKKSINAIKRAIVLSPNFWKHWNLFGVISARMQDYRTAQHCFITSLNLKNNSTSWTNLGVLYLLKGEANLANKAFKEAQDEDPTYIKGWVGQALLAESLDDDSEAMDLFRHSTVLGNDDESCIGYSNWVCKTLDRLKPTSKNPPPQHNKYCLEKLFGITTSLDCLNRYNYRSNLDDSCALNMFGIILEKEGLLSSSKKAFKMALDIVKSQNEAQTTNQVLENLGRLCYKLKEYGNAIEYYSGISNQSFTSLCGLAISSYKAGLLKESYSAYQASLELANEKKSEVLAAMASIAFKVQGADAAKTLLFQSCQVSPVSVRGLFALCVLGIKQKNIQLIQASLKEMNKFIDDPLYMADICTLKSMIASELSNDKNSARKEFSRQLHKYPDQADLWSALAIFLISNEKQNSNLLISASKCASRSAGISILKNKYVDHDIVNLVAFSLLLSCDKSPETLRKLKIAASKSLHLRPFDSGAWSLIISFINLDPEMKSKIKWTKSLLLDNLSEKKDLGDWFNEIISM